ncbi:probable E3 ubiquitin-protein ligase makorin-1 [Parasteatoda tepidariorum]|uniref:probable E3 ubiquitin-protein ligase makorin-1 n=1 Tax=Parasteatoda tepidariorum TaxID=114398 RepID=UPI001C718809|nr:probable E3 ubiquitin-protein ligase makorin-1 [Parasteatoda tepidariorum]
MSIYKEESENIMVCPFFLKSTCLDGENCEFAHTMTKILPKNVACDFYQRGMCKYGKKCWFSHNDGNESMNEIVDHKSEVVNSDDTGSTNLKKRFSFILKDIQEKRKSSMRDCFNELEIAKYFPEITKLGISGNDGAKLPMDRCIHYDLGQCPLRDWCPCVHGKLCDLCQKYCLDPCDRNQQLKHIEDCEKELERDMELSFAIQCSKDKVCGICLEVILDKEKIAHRRFGILEKCNHVFCLECIREWRRRGSIMDSVHPDAAVDQQVMRKCPQCRIRSDFIIPSNFWFHTEEEKINLIEKYKCNLKSKHCKYFSKGEGDCPFGNRCFYLHALSDGTVVELPAPTRQNRRRQNRNREDQLLEELILWNYLDQNEDGLQFYIDDVSFDGSDIVIL